MHCEIPLFHSELEWQFSFGLCIYDFCIPLDFLGIMDLKKIEKGQENVQRPYQRPHLNFIEIL